MFTQPNNSNTATKQPVHSRGYEKVMGLVFLFGTVAALLAVIYVLGFFD